MVSKSGLADSPAELLEVDKAAEDEFSGLGQDLYYVCKKTLEEVTEKLRNGCEITVDTISDLTFPEHLSDAELLVPVDVHSAGKDFNDVEEMVNKLGPKGTAQLFVQAAADFEANKGKEPDDMRAKPMTAATWRDALVYDDISDDLLEEEEECMLESEEESDCFDDEEFAEAVEGELEEDKEGDEKTAEPLYKKRKTG